MAFKTRRQRRYNLLKGAGFLHFEATQLSRLTLRHMKVPYIAHMIKDRIAFMENAISGRWSTRDYRRAIRADYRRNGWYKRTSLGTIRDDPWKMLKATERAYRRHHPSYTSPWEKKPKDFVRFMRSAERTVKRHAQDWITQLNESIRKAKTPEQREQFERQRENLRSWLE